MKKTTKKFLALVLTVVMMAGVFTGCGKKDGGNGTTNGDVTISVMVPTDFEEEIRTILPVFEKANPNIKVDVILSAAQADGTPGEVSKLAAANKLPDVTMGVENFAYILSQGLAYPLDNLYANDPDKDNALLAGVNNYTYNGHLYAMPYRVQFNAILVNMDLMETKNLDAPEYDWTIDEFVSLAKAATDNQYSGINIVKADDATHNLETKLMGGMLESPYQMYGYNMEEREFDFTSGAWVNSKNYIKELRAVPGLIADELKEWSKRNNGVADAYDNKFGGSGDALKAGKVLFGNHNTWEIHWMLDSFNFEWDMYPVPHAQGVDERIQTHVDYVFMTSAVTEEKAQAAYELVKFLSYSEEGCKARMDYSQANPTIAAGVYTPASSDPEVLNYYDEMSHIPNGMKYMLKTISEEPEKIFIADANKLIPNFWNDVEDYLEQVEEQIKNGGDASALAADFQNKVNAATSKTWTNFESKLQKNLDAFYESHQYEKTAE